MITINAENYSKEQFIQHENHLIALLYESVLEPNFFNTFMKELCGLINACSGTLGINNIVTREVRGGWSWNVSLDYLDIYLSGHFASQDKLIHHVMKSSPGEFYSVLGDVEGAEDYINNSVIYRDWAIPQGIRDVAGVLLQRQGDWITFLCIQRRVEQGEFTRLEKQLLGRLTPHIRRALQLHQQTVSAKQLKQPLQDILSMIKCPVMVFNERFEVSYSNDMALEFIDKTAGICLKDNNIIFDTPKTNSEFSFKVMVSVKTSAGIFSVDNSVLHVNEECEHSIPYSILFFPIRSKQKSTNDLDIKNSGSIAFIHTSREINSLPEELYKAYQLTPAESTLCGGLMSGKGIAELARETGKNEQTLRKQAKQLYMKTGTSSQAEMVSALLSNPLFIAFQ